MATELQTRPASSGRSEFFVEQQIDKVKQRLRAIDIGAAALLMLAVTLGYAILMAVFDLIVRGSSEGWVSAVRLVAFLAYLIAMAGCGIHLVRRCVRRINPYYCAHQLEQTIPGAKNSVINWLDLRGERLPPAIRSSLGAKAAHDLKETDAEQVADPKPTWFMGGVVGALAVILVILFALSPNQFGSLLARAFVPFRDISLANRATIKLIRPDGGDVEVSHNQRVEFVVEIEGRFPKANHPQAPTLWYRYGQSDPFVPTPLDEDAGGQWTKTMAADQVQNGFWYKITAGDAETKVYQVTTRSLPEARRFEVTYHYRPYRKLADETIVFPNEFAVFPELRGERGTEVSLVVHANQPVREGKIQIHFGDVFKDVPGEPLADDPSAFRCKFTLERSGQYMVIFQTKSQVSNTDRTPYRIDVRPDLPPVVTITKPSQDISAAANGTVPIEGLALDDFGIKSMALKLRVLEGERKPNLMGQPYRPGKKFQFDTGAYPTKIDYLDVLALDQVKTDAGQLFPLSPNMVLEAWLEATDNSDYPSPGGAVGRSKAIKIKIDPPKDEKQQKQERQQAQDQKNKHDKQQDQQHQKENQDKKDEARNQKGAGKSPEERQADDLKEKRDQAAKDIKDKLDQQEKKDQQGAGKGGDPQKADSKPGDGQQPETNPKDANAGKEPPKAGDKKDNGGQGDKNDGPKSAEAKGPGDPKKTQDGHDKQSASEPKGSGNEKPQPSAKGSDGKDKGGNQPEQQPASAKAGPKDDPKQQPGEGKDQGKQGDGGMSKTAQSKDNAPKDDDKMNPGAQAKAGDGNKDAPQPQAKNDKKDSLNKGGKQGDSKPGGGEQLTKEKGAGNAKPDAAASKEPPGADGSRKPAQAKGSDEPVRKAQSKEGAGGSSAETQQGPPAQAKSQPMTNNPMDPKSQPQGSAKETPADQAKESAQAKDEKGQGPPRAPTMKDLERLKDQLAKGDPNALKSAEELKRNLPESTDPKVGKAGEELLKDAAKKLEEMARNEKQKENANTTGPGQKQTPMGNASEPMTAQGGNEKDPNPRKGDTPPKNQPGEKAAKGAGPGGSGPNGQNFPDNLKPSEANKDFADRLANLQLEDLKKRVTPEALQRAGISEAEWQQYLKDAQAYEQLRQKIVAQPKAGKDQIRAKSSTLQNTRPRQVLPSGNNDAAAVNRAGPPPDLREAQRLFTQKK